VQLFRGQQTASVDDKGRLKLPRLVVQRLQEEYESPQLFITSLDGEWARIYPIKEWEIVERKLAEKSTESRELDGAVKDKILFQANRFGAEQALDSQGRILVPAALREAAGMRGEVRMLAHANHIRALNAERFNEAAERMRLTPEDLNHAANLGV